MIEVNKNSALPDRENEIQINEYHYVNKNSVKNYHTDNYSEVFLGLGCFWGAERLFWELPYVHITSVGYGGGFTKNPTYQDICSGKTGHAELVKVVFEKQQNIFKKVLKVFFENHDPTQGMRQGNDIGTQYRSCIYTNNDVYHDLSISLLKEYQDTLEKNNFNKLITTEIKMNERFFNAEDYHQQYLAKNPQGYCGIQGLGLNLDI
ncbi:MAG: peptide-methionine (S)-S-oxide reductase [Gammaproteobacteria bacterium]|nr:peptide-methionine (S)-S-oxide reductase [Gammaproteobacteria bacterium]|tara:strand:+ start:72 stop:689 length:618 start_codon:yes stop_codon:yes gene_type:complete